MLLLVIHQHEKVAIVVVERINAHRVPKGLVELRTPAQDGDSMQIVLLSTSLVRVSARMIGTVDSGWGDTTTPIRRRPAATLVHELLRRSASSSSRPPTAVRT